MFSGVDRFVDIMTGKVYELEDENTYEEVGYTIPHAKDRGEEGYQLVVKYIDRKLYRYQNKEYISLTVQELGAGVRERRRRRDRKSVV